MTSTPVDASSGQGQSTGTEPALPSNPTGAAQANHAQPASNGGRHVDGDGGQQSSARESPASTENEQSAGAGQAPQVGVNGRSQPKGTAPELSIAGVPSSPTTPAREKKPQQLQLMDDKILPMPVMQTMQTLRSPLPAMLNHRYLRPSKGTHRQLQAMSYQNQYQNRAQLVVELQLHRQQRGRQLRC